jgi:hypothetical protein
MEKMMNLNSYYANPFVPPLLGDHRQQSTAAGNCGSVFGSGGAGFGSHYNGSGSSGAAGSTGGHGSSGGRGYADSSATSVKAVYQQQQQQPDVGGIQHSGQPDRSSRTSVPDGSVTGDGASSGADSIGRLQQQQQLLQNGHMHELNAYEPRMTGGGGCSQTSLPLGSHQQPQPRWNHRSTSGDSRSPPILQQQQPQQPQNFGGPNDDGVISPSIYNQTVHAASSVPFYPWMSVVGQYYLLHSMYSCSQNNHVFNTLN